jgi:hypothetical protein
VAAVSDANGGSIVTGRAAAAVLALTYAAALVLAGCGSHGENTKPKIQSTVRPGVAPTPPSRGAYFGAWVNPGEGSFTQQGRIQAVQNFERSIGRELDIVHTYRTWDEPFPRAADNAVLNSDRYLMLSWNGTDTRLIASGAEDQIIKQRARAIKATGRPIFLRYQWEMDRPNVKEKIHSPRAFIAAWKHIRGIFRRQGVDNVAWVWCPTAKGFSDHPNASSYYPGDDQVDWVCADVYPGHDNPYRNLSEAAKRFLSWARTHPKPVMIGEFGVPRSYGPRRAEWLRAAAEAMQIPRIKAVLYFDSDMEGKGVNESLQFSLEGDPAALSAMRELATTPFFNPRSVPVRS